MTPRRTRIVATLGPASQTPERVEELLRAGLDVARLNFSHGDPEGHARVLALLRDQARRLNRPVTVFQDLAGPKIRVGAIAGGTVRLEPGARFVLSTEPRSGSAEGVSISYAGLPREVQPGDTLLLSDGALELEVVETSPTAIVCRVVVGGTLSSHKGVNVPARRVGLPSLTEKDLRDLKWGAEHDVDYVALSFLRSAADVGAARAALRAQGREDIPLIAKIERHEALEHLEEILAAADAVMIARGDLGVEIPLERVPRLQKSLIAAAHRAGKPVITATQMLRSMVENPRPTRAEATDVANAIWDGTDAVMLSEETAIGRYPVEAVAMMDRLARDAESVFPHDEWELKLARTAPASASEAVARAACRLARDVGAAAILTCTASGSTARQVARCRPPQPILALTPHETTRRRLALVWGVHPLAIPPVESFEEMVRHACAAALASPWVRAGQTVVLTAGLPLAEPGMTNMIRVLTLGRDGPAS